MRRCVRSASLALLFVSALGACTPQAALIASLIPQGTVHTLLGNFERVSEHNRQRIDALEREQKWPELASFADANLLKDRSNSDWWLVLGYARAQMRDQAGAVDAFRQGVRLEPDNAAAWHLLAQSYRAMGQSQRAVNTLNSAVLALRDSPMTYYLLAESYTDLGLHSEAAAAYERARSLEAQAANEGFAR